MADRASEGKVLVLSRSWVEAESENAFIMRGVAAALGRTRPVAIRVPGHGDGTKANGDHADGAFDVIGTGGLGQPVDWSSSTRIQWTDSPPAAVLVEAGDRTAITLAMGAFGSVPVVEVGEQQVSTHGTTDDGATSGGADYRLSLAPPDEDSAPSHFVRSVSMHVPINPLAMTRRHNGLGFIGYLLLLCDAPDEVTDELPGEAADELPHPIASWLAASYTRLPVVAIQDAVASVYFARALIGRIAVDTRTDLWRLMAFASLVIDLDPGPHLARECVEAQRLGTPTIAPARTSGARLGAAGGGLWFGDVSELLGCIDAARENAVSQALSGAGRAVTDSWYGDPAACVRSVADAIDFVVSDTERASARRA